MTKKVKKEKASKATEFGITEKRINELEEISHAWINLHLTENKASLDILFNILLELKKDRDANITENEFYYILINAGCTFGRFMEKHIINTKINKLRLAINGEG